jgi:hypothetical protein
VRKTLAAQVLELVPWKTIGRIALSITTLGRAGLLRVTAFAQITRREWHSLFHAVETFLGRRRILDGPTQTT